MRTLQDSINWAQGFVEYPPLSAGTGGEPAVSTANMIQDTIMTAPFTWAWNREESQPFAITPDQQTYTVDIDDFSFLEKVTLTCTQGANGINVGDVWEITDGVRNINSQSIANPNKKSRPQAACVFSVEFGTSVTIRFGSYPDTNYNATLVYQTLAAPLTTANSPWAIPDQYADIYDNLFLAEVMSIVDDARSVQYRQRGIATLLARAEGLSDMEKNLFYEQYWVRFNQQQASALRVQQGSVARQV